MEWINIKPYLGLIIIGIKIAILVYLIINYAIKLSGKKNE